MKRVDTLLGIFEAPSGIRGVFVEELLNERQAFYFFIITDGPVSLMNKD